MWVWVTVGIVFVLVLYVISANVRYAVRQYLGSNQRVLFSLYLSLLVLFGVIAVRSTLRVASLFQDSRAVIEEP